MKVSFEEVISAADDSGMLVDISNIKSSDLLSDAGIDSLESMNFFLAIEEKFGINIPEEDIDSLKTIDDIINYMEKF